MDRIRYSQNPTAFEKLEQLFTANPQLLYHHPIALGQSDFDYSRNNLNLSYDNPVALYNPSTFYRFQHDHPLNVPVNNNNINFNDYGNQPIGNSHR